jgi:xanthine dehydrogenase YagT iron-sulfur-binding subunit
MNNPDTYRADDPNRRRFLKQSTALTSLALLPPLVAKAATDTPETASTDSDRNVPAFVKKRAIVLTINKKSYRLEVEPRETLLDVLRERLDLTGAKKGCDHGQCGACTVHIDGRTANACLSLAIMQQGRTITTIEGVATNKNALHPLQTAFLEHDGYQCGFCTPGQIMAGIACIREGHADSPDEVREWMSGNICRCGAYEGIVKAVSATKQNGKAV